MANSIEKTYWCGEKSEFFKKKKKLLFEVTLIAHLWFGVIQPHRMNEEEKSPAGQHQFLCIWYQNTTDLR